VLSAVMGAFMIYACVGRQPAFVVPDVNDAQWHVYLAVIPCAILCSLVGALYQRYALAGLTAMQRASRILP